MHDRREHRLASQDFWTAETAFRTIGAAPNRGFATRTSSHADTSIARVRIKGATVFARDIAAGYSAPCATRLTRAEGIASLEMDAHPSGGHLGEQKARWRSLREEDWE
jgi:hypothetical protein